MYYKVKSVKITDDKITVNCACNNVYPLTYSNTDYLGDSFGDRLKNLFDDIMNGNIQFTPKATVKIDIKQYGDNHVTMEANMLYRMMTNPIQIHTKYTSFDNDHLYGLNRIDGLYNILYEKMFKPFIKDDGYSHQFLNDELEAYDNASMRAYEDNLKELHKKDIQLIQHATMISDLFPDKVMLLSDTENKLYIADKNYYNIGKLHNMSKAICLDITPFDEHDIWQTMTAIENYADSYDINKIGKDRINFASELLGRIQIQAEKLGYSDMIQKCKDLSMTMACFGKEEPIMEGKGLNNPHLADIPER